MNNSDNHSKDIDIELSEEIAGGVFSNLAVINHSPTEFVLDFIQLMPGVEKAKVKSRIILTPEHARNLHKALGENISKFEELTKSSSKIKDLPINFGPKGQA